MAKRRLKKNLVAFLTVAGGVLAVAVVAIATINATRRDPATIAAKAKAQEDAGDLKRAVALYRSAYGVSQDAKYLIEAARCAHQMGELNEMFSLLHFAHAQAPRDPRVLNAVLERYWEIRDVSLRQWTDVLERAQSLLNLEPDNILALASKFTALEELKTQEPRYATEADATLRRAVESDPTSPYVALARARRSQAQAREEARAAFGKGRHAQAQATWEAARAERIEFLQPAVDAHPNDVSLRIALARELLEGQQWEQSRAVLEAGLAPQPDDAELRQAMANSLLQEVRLKLQEADKEQIRVLVDEGLVHVNKAIQLEPALYLAYALRGELLQLGWIKDGRWESDLRGCQKEILESYTAALRDTVGVRSIRAVLGQLDRLQMIGTAFNRTLTYYRGTTDEAVQAQAETFLRRFLQEGQTQYPAYALTSLMEGHMALVDGDNRRGIKAFSRAEQQADKYGTSAGFGRLAKEELARLYRSAKEPGLSLRYTLEVIDIYERMGRIPPSWLYLNQAQVLLELDRPQEVVDLLEPIANTYPQNAALKAVHARALTELGRIEEGRELMQTVAADDPQTLLLRARVAVYQRDYETAVPLLRKVLESRPESVSTIRLLMHTLVAAERTDEAAQFIRERLEQTTDDRLRRLLRSYDLLLSEDDPEQRQQKVLELIAEVPDDFERAAEYFDYWVGQDDLERAAGYLDEMEHLREAGSKADTEVLRLQFDMALRQENCERAAKYAVALAGLNADQVGGATFRGRYELSCGDPAQALSEFRAAEREFPNDSQLKIRTAQALLRLKLPRYDEAIQALEQAVEFDPRNFTARKLLYACYEQTGRYRQGIPHLEEATRLDPDDPFVKQRAELLEEERDPRQGIARRETLREQQPGDVGNLLRLADLYERIGDGELAEQRLRAAAQAEPANVQVARFGAELFARRGQREAGEQLLQQHLAEQEGLGKIRARVLLARFYESLGDQDAALRTYQQAQERAGEPSSVGSEEERRRAMMLAASELADFYRRTQRFEEMIDAYRVVLTHLDPSETALIQSARRSIIRGLLSLRQYGDAAQAVAEYRREFPKDLQGMMAEAELLMRRDQLEEARELLSRVLEDEPDHAWSRYMRGQINIEQRRYTDARDDLLRAKDVAPDAFNYAHRFILARLYQLMEKPELAEVELRELLALQRDESRNIETALIGLLRNSGQFEKAQMFINELSAREPQEAFWPHQLGRLLVAQEEYSAAAQPLQRAYELTEGKNAQVIADWLFALVKGNRAREATQVYEALRPPAITPRVQAHAAEAYLQENQRDVAVALLEQGIRTGSLLNVGVTRRVVAWAADVLGREEGLAVLRGVLERASDPTARLRLRSTLARHLVNDEDPARRAEGLEMADAVIAAAPRGDPLHVEALMVRALALEETGEHQEVGRLYEEVLKQAPDHVAALNNLAYLLADKVDRATEALPYAQRLRDLASDNPTVLDTVGWVYLKCTRVEQAEGIFLEALRIDPGHLAARYHLGELYLASGNRAAAERAFRRVLEAATEQENEEYKKKAEEAMQKVR